MNLVCKYICTVWHSKQTGEGRLLQRGASLLVAVTSAHDDSREDSKFIMSQTDCFGK